VFHEFGHYVIARLFGVEGSAFLDRVREGLVADLARRDQTGGGSLRLPLGGYVKMLDEHEGRLRPRKRTGAFNRQNVWRRIDSQVPGAVGRPRVAGFFTGCSRSWLLLASAHVYLL